MTEPSAEHVDTPGAEIVQFRPRNSLTSKMSYAKALAESGMLPAAYRGKPANVLWATEYGEMLGLSAMAAIVGIHVIEQKPTASAALVSSLVRRAGHRIRTWGDDEKATTEIVRSDDPDFTFRSEWTLARAKKAGLLGKGTWEKYPASLLKARTITECARDACQEVLMGVQYTPEELGVEVDEEGVPTTIVEQVRPEPAVEVDWDAEIAKCGADRAKLLALYNRAPEGLAKERIKAAGLRAKAAVKPAETEPITVDAELVDDEPARPLGASQLLDALLAANTEDKVDALTITIGSDPKVGRVDIVGILSADAAEVLGITRVTGGRLPLTDLARAVRSYVGSNGYSVNEGVAQAKAELDDRSAPTERPLGGTGEAA